MAEKELRRYALDGELYTEAEFKKFYGAWLGKRMWTQAASESSRPDVSGALSSESLAAVDPDNKKRIQAYQRSGEIIASMTAKVSDGRQLRRELKASPPVASSSGSATSDPGGLATRTASASEDGGSGESFDVVRQRLLGLLKVRVAEGKGDEKEFRKQKDKLRAAPEFAQYCEENQQTPENLLRMLDERWAGAEMQERPGVAEAACGAAVAATAVESEAAAFACLGEPPPKASASEHAAKSRSPPATAKKAAALWLEETGEVAPPVASLPCMGEDSRPAPVVACQAAPPEVLVKATPPVELLHSVPEEPVQPPAVARSLIETVPLQDALTSPSAKEPCMAKAGQENVASTGNMPTLAQDTLSSWMAPLSAGPPAPSSCGSELNDDDVPPPPAVPLPPWQMPMPPPPLMPVNKNRWRRRSGEGQPAEAQEDATSRRSLLNADELEAIRAQSRARNLSVLQLHGEARALLTTLAQGEDAAPIDLQQSWPTWREYLALHKNGQDIVGPGVVKITAERIAGTKDPNRYGRMRLDFFVHRSDGSAYRLHPGQRSKLDAKPVFLPAVVLQSTGEATDTAVPPKPLATLQAIPQSDRYGKDFAFNMLRQLTCEPEEDLTDGRKFAWPLLFANLGRLFHRVVAREVLRVRLTEQQRNRVALEVTNSAETLKLVLQQSENKYGTEVKITVEE